MGIDIKVSNGTDGLIISVQNANSNSANSNGDGSGGAIVIGPIVIDDSVPVDPSSAGPGGGGPGISPGPGPGGGGPGISPGPGPGGSGISPGPGPGGSGISPGPGPGGSGISPGPGPGGGGFGSGGIVVIGPIVIAGARAGGVPYFVPSTFPLKHQEEANWCWAAVTQAVRAFFYPAALLTQCSIAGTVLAAEYPASTPFSCCQDPDQCDIPAPLQDALTVTNNLRSTMQGQVLTFEQIKAELTGTTPKPVCVRIEWANGGAHFIAIYGYREFTSGIRQVLVADPLFQDGTAAYVLYEDLLDFYDQYGRWSDTFLVKA